MLETIDWVVISVFFSISIAIGLYYRKSAGKDIGSFFLGGRNLPWYVAGLSMVATTFAADTPLWVTEVIHQHGISGNWLWWNMLIGGMLTTFFFAKYWRRAEVLTELEFIELRYSGKPAAFLRGFKSVYMGLFLNAIIIAWVNYALLTILEVFTGISSEGIPWYENPLIGYVALAMLFTAGYSALSGLKGVVITDTVQFFVAMIGCILLAWFVLDTEQVGGIQGLKAQLPEWRFNFFPTIGSTSDTAEVLSISLGAFLTFFAVQWWASWYPGAEPGGGGYIAQRMMSAKDERNAQYATLFFQIAHFCLRPWPWIIVGLGALVLYPNLPAEQAGHGFVYTMRDVLPAGLRGLLLVAFLSAYMSTISTQLNWGASFLTNDLYRRFIKKPKTFSDDKEADRHYVATARILTGFIMVVSLAVTTQLETIDAAAKFLIQAGAGLGLVLILRWYWWRINAWSEISAMAAPLVVYFIAKEGFQMEFPESFLLTTGITTVIWLVVTFSTQPANKAVLQAFFDKVKPAGNWKPFGKSDERLGPKFLMWLSAIVMTYATLFSSGYLVFQEYTFALVWGVVAIIGLVVLLIVQRRTLA